MNDIIDAVPIDKYFELFKPKAGGDGGFIRISMDFVPASTAEPAGNGTLLPGGRCTEQACGTS